MKLFSLLMKYYHDYTTIYLTILPKTNNICGIIRGENLIHKFLCANVINNISIKIKNVYEIKLFIVKHSCDEYTANLCNRFNPILLQYMSNYYRIPRYIPPALCYTFNFFIFLWPFYLRYTTGQLLFELFSPFFSSFIFQFPAPYEQED